MTEKKTFVWVFHEDTKQNLENGFLSDFPNVKWES